jgi:hypothetical protein
VFHALRDVDHLSFPPHPQGEVKAGVKLASCALAAGLPTGPLHGDQAATKERVFVNKLSKAGTGTAFRIGEVSSASHEDSLLYLIYLNISDKGGLSTKFLNANLPKRRNLNLTHGIYEEFSDQKSGFTELLIHAPVRGGDPICIVPLFQ